MNKSKRKNPARTVALVGICAASIECGKLALMALPNIEVVSILIALFSYSFGFSGLLATFIFVLIEPLLFGFGSWFISYLIYWPLLSLVFLFLGKIKMQNRWLITVIAVTMTFLFGVISSLVDIGLFSGLYEDFFTRFFIYYVRGIPFYVLQIATNAVIFPMLFTFLAKRLKKIGERLL
jgi:energy-coupling factor transport system substrate-specific component